MRIAFLGDYNHPNAQSWIQALKEYGHCEVLTWSLPITENREGRMSRIMHWFTSLKNIRRELKKMKPDLVIAYRITSYGFIGAVSGFHPLVIASQGGMADIWPLHSLSTPLKKLMARVSLKKADLIHAWGAHIAEAQINLGADPSKILVLPRGINLNKFYASAEPPVNASMQIAVTRSLYPEYSHNVILDACALLAKNNIPFTLHIVGTGAEMNNLKAIASTLGIEAQVIFHGRIPNDKLPELLRCCDIYTSVPRTEGVSASLFEAMACGCYPIVSDLIAYRSLIDDGKNGTLVPLDDSQRLYEAFRQCWENPSGRMNARNQNIALVQDKASIHKNIGIFISHYEKLIASYGQG